MPALLVGLVALWWVAEAQAGPGGVPGTGDLTFDPASDTEDNHCDAPIGDLNALYGLSEQVLGPSFCATVVNSGEFTILVYRFIASSAEQGADFESVLVSLRLVVDGHTEYVYSPDDVLLVLDNPLFPDGWLQLTYLPRLPPQAVGTHTAVYYWTVSEAFSGPIQQLPAGETLFSSVTFEVVPGASQSQAR